MAASALLGAISAASLNLCSDEYLLLLAKAPEVASVSYLAQEPLETPLWRLGRRHHANRGSIEDVLGRRPNLLLTMGGGGRASSLLARRLKIRSIDLTPPQTLEGVARNLRLVAEALGEPKRADTWLARLDRLRRTAPRSAVDAIWLSAGGHSLAAGSLGARWLRLAGFEQRPLPGSRVTLETMLVRPPAVLVRSDYRSGQMSSGARWLDHPVVRRAASRQLATDGRPWTCMGPLMIGEIERLRGLRR